MANDGFLLARGTTKAGCHDEIGRGTGPPLPRPSPRLV